MITPLTVYVVGILDAVKTTLTITTIMLLLASAVLWIAIFVFHVDGGPDCSRVKKAAKIMVAICLIVGMATCATPSSRLAAAMYIVPAIANNKDLQAIGGNSLEGLRRLSEEWLKNLTGQKTKHPQARDL